MSGRTVSVSEGPRLARSMAIGPHTLTADESEPLGADTGPTPVEVLLGALGSCTSMAVRASADRHGWPLDRVDVDVRFDAEGQIVRRITLAGDLDATQTERLLATAGRCPVHRLLTGDVTVITVPVVMAAPTGSGDGAARERG
ncbi:OsmC family protein [Streptomyces sp. NPDC052023]|uniref:OsmC family protein n=1 Tax=Streptomyces sp. NPDC052023 TaxID=3365681 RepID=UPI0037D09EE9